MRSILFIFLITLVPSVCLGQTGPGGPGDIVPGGSGLRLWLDAGTISGLANNANMTGTWTDQSGNGNNASIGTAPQYKTAGAGNGQPSLFFGSGNSEYMIVSGNSEVMPTNELSVFVVASYESSSTSWGSIISTYSDDAADDGWAFERETATNQMRFYIDDYYDGNKRCDHTMTYSQDEVWSMVFNTTDNDVSTYLSENTPCTEGFNGPIEYDHGNNLNDLYIGEALDGAWMTGDISEIIIYNVAVNDAQRIIISNYLAAKYDIDLANYDLYDEDDATEEYDHDVAGIGQAADGTSQLDSWGTGVVGMSGASHLQDKEYLIWGHDNGAWSADETVDVPSGVAARIERVWRVSERKATGSSTSTATNVGKTDVYFDLTGLGSVTASDLRLLIDSNDDGLFNDDSDTIAGATDEGGNIYKFAQVVGGNAGIKDNRRFTLGTINKNQTPLPITLLSFDAEISENNTVKLTWQTVSEINNDYFTVEHSVDGDEWSSVGKVAGRNSNLMESYSLMDENPYSGLSYYRLKQTDYNGSFTYSKVVPVTIEEETPILIYPNPAKEHLTIIGGKSELQHIRIFDLLGKDVTRLVSFEVIESEKFNLDIRNLSRGLYLIETNTSINKFYKQ